MGKKSFIVVIACFVCVCIYFGVDFLESLKSTNKISEVFTEDSVHGSDAANLKLKIIGLANSKISQNFTTALIEKSTGLVENKNLHMDVEFIGAPGSRTIGEIVEQIKSAEKPTLMVLSPEVILTDESRLIILESEIPAFIFSSIDTTVCNKRSLSNNIWNFGLPLQSFSETYLSFINQKYGELARDLKVFLYVNDDKRLLAQVESFEKTIKGLGLKVEGKLIVDERQDDLYTTVRQVFDYDPRIIVGLTSRRGLKNFLNISSRLSLTFDMGVSIIEGAFEEDLIDFGENSRAIIVPSAYIYGAKDSSGDYKITTSMYQGLLVGGFLETFFFRGLGDNITPENIIERIEKLDGVRYEGLSGLVTFDSKTHGLIQPIHIGEFKNGRLNHIQYLGDVSLAAADLCKD